tara:strand:- start:44 stop:382 length:339 start_codon:yes stop_codon:yes gene_type:complete
MSAYIKQKSDGAIMHSCSLQTVANPEHLKSCQDFLTSRGMSVNDFIIADATEAEIQVMVKDAETSTEKAQAEIQNLESTITPRRLRDAIANDAGKSWVANVEALIDTERGKL